MQNNKIFEYALYNAWHFPITCIAVFDGEHGSVTFGDYQEENFGLYHPDHSADQSIDISHEALASIKTLLSASGLRKIKELETPAVLDGYIQEFYLNNGKNAQTIHGTNLDYCIGDPESFPKAAKVIEFLDKLADILVSEGVDEKYFLFSPEDEYTSDEDE